MIKRIMVEDTDLQSERRAVAVTPYAYFGLGLLFLVSFFNYMDRYMLAVLLPAIKIDLNLSDTQIGFITGFAFTIVYASFGLPIARLADRYSRRTIISLALSFWSLMTAACGLTQNFIQLTLARVMVGLGEAGASPPSHSLIADYFPVHKRAMALGVYSLGAPVGILIGFTLGGWLTELYSWRVALFVVGLPGVVLATVLLVKLKEPERGQSDGIISAVGGQSFWRVCATLAKSSTFCFVSVATGFYSILWLGVVQWLPSFFDRSHGMSAGELSTSLAVILGTSQLIGMLIAGYISDYFGRQDLRWYVWVPGFGILISTPLFFITFLTDSATLALLSLFMPFMLGVMQGPPSFAVVQGVAGLHMRAMAAAIYLMVANMIGGGIGPQAIGFLSDLWEPSYGGDSLRFALLAVAVVSGFIAAFLYFVAARFIKSDFKVPLATE